MQSSVASKSNFAGCTGDGPTWHGFSHGLQYVAMMSCVPFKFILRCSEFNTSSIYEEPEHEFLTQKCHEDTINIMLRRDAGTIKKVT